jgi:CheY-like chemotaxis protein
MPIRVFRPEEPQPQRRSAPSWQLPEERPITLSGVRVLVVDDDANTRDVLVELLDEAGAVIEQAESAANGLAVLQRFRPQLLISDIGMPGEDGYSLMRRVRALDLGAHIPSIALTAYASEEDRTKALAAGFTAHVSKPVDPYDLLISIAELLANARRDAS